MEYKSAGESEDGTSVCEEEGAGWLTSTPQPPRRPLQHLNTVSPRPQVTPYKYHGCRAIPEEEENQENIDPSTRAVVDPSGSTKSSGVSSDNATHTGSDSSPFAYPLIWESSHTSITPSSSSPADGKRPHLMGGDTSTWRSPISHFRDHKSLLATPIEVRERSGTSEDHPEGKESKKVRNRSGSSNEASNSKAACHHAPSVTPSKVTHTQTHTNASVFLTPSSSMRSSRPGEGRGGQTPKQQQHPISLSASQSINPFEVGAESLYLSAVSPSLFQQVVSPSQKVGSNFRWSIDQMAELYPVNIETSPFTQVEVFGDPEYERQAQDAIDRFFTSHHPVVPSPWTGSNKSVSLVKKMCLQQSQASPSLPPASAQSVWCQTELSLPPVLPPALEEALKPFCTFTQSQWWQGSGEGDEAANLNNTTLRRKLLFSQEDFTANTPLMDSPQDGSEASSPSASSSPHRDDRTSRQDAEKQVKEEVEARDLMWCTEVLGKKESASSMRQHPLTPPLACGATPSTTATTPRQATHRGGTSPLAYTVDAGPPVSPDVSPIHILEYSSDLEIKQTPLSTPSPGSGFLENQHTHGTFISADEAPQQPSLYIHSHTPSHTGIPQLEGAEGKGAICPNRMHLSSPPQSRHQSHSSFSEVVSSSSHTGTKEENMQSDHKELEKSADMTKSFCIQYTDKDQKPESPVTSSSTNEHKSSSNSGHFSSSPIQDILYSPLEVDSPARRFSASPPLSPILCRTLMFPAQPCTRQQPVTFRKERKQVSEIIMIEEGEAGVPPALSTLQRCSSLCDVEMDSQPSLESNFGEEAPSQDTGYQTISSLLGSNFSCSTFPQDPTPLRPLIESRGPTKRLPATARSKEFRS